MRELRERRVTAGIQFALSDGGGQVVDGSAVDADERGVRDTAHEVVGCLAGGGCDDDFRPGEVLAEEAGRAVEESVIAR